MKGELIDNRVLIKGKAQTERLIQRGFGSRKNDEKIELSTLEALFLIERGTLEVTWKGKKIGKAHLIKESKDEEDFIKRYIVYKDLRERGYVVKTGFKFGAHFRVYEKGEFSLNGHSTLLVQVVQEDAKFSFPEISGAVRLTQSVKKKLIYAVVDHEGDITYYLVDRIIP